MNKIYPIFAIGFLIFHRIIFSQTENITWMIQAGGPLDDYSRSVTVDQNNNAYITGEFHQSAIFGNENLISNNYAVFLAKYDELDSFLWVVQASANHDIFSTGNGTDNENNIYITGHFSDTLTIGDTIIVGSTLLYSAYLAKFDDKGIFQWARSAYGNYDLRSYSLAVNSLNHIYIIGEFRGNLTFGNDTVLNEDPTRHTVFIAKYDNDGNLIHVHTISGDDCVHGRYIYIDKADNSYILGGLYQNADFGDTIINAMNGTHYFAKFDNNDNFLWARQATSAIFYSVSTDTDYNVYLAGQLVDSSIIENDTLFANGNTDIFIAKYNSNGDFLWVKQIGGNGEEECNSICTDGNDKFFIGGSFNNIVHFGNDSVVSLGNKDAYIAKFDSSGNFLFVKGLGSIGNDNCKSLAFSNSKKLFATGIYNGTLYWDNGSLETYGSSDIFLTVLYDIITNNNIQNNVFITRIYPNPADEYIILQITNGENGVYLDKDKELRIYDLLGNEVQISYLSGRYDHFVRNDISNSPSLGERGWGWAVDISNLPKGVYLLKINSNIFSGIEKIIIF